MKTRFDELSLVSAVRAGGKHRAERRFLDFQVGRRRLSDLLDVHDQASVLGWLARRDEQRAARQLLLLEPSPFDSGRVPLYLCPECAALGCGAVSVRLAFETERVTWSDFRHESFGGSSPVQPPWPLRDFVFDREAYRLLLWPFT